MSLDELRTELRGLYKEIVKAPSKLKKVDVVRQIDMLKRAKGDAPTVEYSEKIEKTEKKDISKMQSKKAEKNVVETAKPRRTVKKMIEVEVDISSEDEKPTAHVPKMPNKKALKKTE